MKPAFFIAIAALCALVVVQWVRESRLHRDLSEMDLKVQSSYAAQADLEDKLRMWEAEIKRLTEAGTAAEKKETELSTEITRLTEQLTLQQQPPPAPGLADAVKTHNEETTRQNEAIAKQNEALKKLTAERDALVEKLNARTKEFNELTEKYNKLVR